MREGPKTDARVLPADGQEWPLVRERLQALRDLDVSPELGRLNIYCHQGTEQLATVRDEAARVFAHSNAFLSKYLDGSRQVESEVRRMVVEILRGGPDAQTFLTTGGTESIFCAIHAAREWSRVERPTPGVPEVILPYSGHAAFDKACHYLGMKIVRVPVRPDYRADVAAMAAAITPNTVAIVGSAPCWPYGTIDPIPDLAKLALEHNLWMHIDACVGGFVNPWLERLGYELPGFDFRVPGVRSMSADLHKHGYAAKPCSTVTFSSRELERYHFVPVDNWPDGEYKTTGFVGSRPMSSVATAWAVLQVLGEQGYLDLTRRCMETKAALVRGIESIADFRCLDNDSTMVYFRSESLDMLTVIGGMADRGYFPFGVFNPVMLQLVAEPVEPAVIDSYLRDLRQVADGVADGTITSTSIARYS
ncbi:pyridoxal phosphate-dependent decarboxylase family protein [Nocardia rhizosphaerae]|uniref:Pyridoxal phosphate-dependent decarboxylase family protein n=1 Tax=Nocardia rhizosphaerae TaxID=1691571 RepID=A0ABV8L9W3_9NOCA